ncbi:GtrA family protein [Granulicella sp. WH15]|uniref:GtrA family protein n=1 Tax=Granulicella sp. WH15 TaxID=2602070 RepID=UPI0013A5639C|nr:GtrA family protein [Granulicella sp. WH15]
MTNSVSTAMPETPRPHGPFASLRRKLPAGEVIRFLMVGGFNTLFSLLLYSGFVILYSHLLPHRGKPLIADLSSICAKPIAITVAFLCYKHFVFRTKGNYLKELLRCFAVYGVSTPAELVILPVATHLFLAPALTHPYAPFLAGIVNAGIIATYSYFAHKKFSFKR